MATDYTTQINAASQSVSYTNATASDLAVYNAELNNGTTQATVDQQIVNSTFVAQNVDPIILLYQAAFGRVPDAAGLQAEVQALESGVSLAPKSATDTSNLAFQFASSSEFTARYGVTATSPNTPALVYLLYQNILGRAPDAAGLAYWTGQTQLNAQQLLYAFANPTTDPEYATKASAYVKSFEYDETGGAGSQAVPTAGSLFSVTSNAGYTGTAPVGSTFTLTVNPDSGAAFTTAATGAIFNAPNAVAPLTFAQANTLSTGDNLQDTAGDGTLNATLVANGIVQGVTTSGIATANVTALNSSGTVGYSGSITGLKTLNSQNSTQGIQVGQAGQGILTPLANLNINANAEAAGSTLATVFVAAAAGSASNALAIGLNSSLGSATGSNADKIFVGTDGAAGTATAPNLAYGTYTLTQATGSSFIQLGDATQGVDGATTIKIAGAGNLTLSADTTTTYSKVATIDASASTGNVYISGALGSIHGGTGGAAGFLTSDIVLTSFKGSAGTNILDVSNETVAQVTALTADATASKVTNNDIDVSALVADTTVATTFANIKGFQILGIAGANGTINDAVLPTSINDILLDSNATGAVTINNITQTFTLDVEQFGNGQALTIGNIGPNPGATDVLNLILGNTTGTSGTTLGAVTINGEEVLNITAQGSTTPGLNTDTLGGITFTPTVGSNETINITGLSNVNTGAITTASGSVSLVDTGTGALTLGGGPLSTINAATAASVFDTNVDTFALATGVGATITGSAKGNNTISGGVGNDTITGGSATDNFQTDGGADKITLGTGHTTDSVFIEGSSSTAGGAPVAGSITSTTGTAGDLGHQGYFGLLPGTANTSVASLFGGAATSGGTSADQVTVAGFTTGSTSANADKIVFSVSAWATNTTAATATDSNSAGLVLTDGHTQATTGAAVFTAVTSGQTLPVAGAGADIVDLTGQNFTNASAVATALHSGSFTLNFSGTGVAAAAAGTLSNDAHLLVAYSDGTNLHIADVDFINTAGAAQTASTALTEHASDLVQLTGVSALTSLTGLNVQLVA